MNKKKIILFDIDYTLFDTTKYKKNIAKRIASMIGNQQVDVVYEAIEEVSQEVHRYGHFDPVRNAQLFIKKFPTRLSIEEIKEIWWQKDILKESLYSETLNTLTELQQLENTTLGVFSTGNSEFQRAKISSVEDLLHKNHIHIFSNKEENLAELMHDYCNDELYLVDDFVSLLAKAKMVNSSLFAIWIKRGKFAEHAQMPEGFFPDAKITNLQELLPIVDNLVVE